MRRSYVLIALLIIILFTGDVLFFFYSYKTHLQSQKHLISQQISNCGSEIERTAANLENDINYLLFNESTQKLFTDNPEKENEIEQLQLLYSKYNGLITNIIVYDNQRNVFNLYRNQKDEFIVDSYISRQQELLVNKEKSEGDNGIVRYIFPIFKEQELYGNLEITLNLVTYINSVLDRYHAGTALWQWIISNDAHVLSNNLTQNPLQIDQLQTISDSLKEGASGSIQHKVHYNQKQNRMLTVYYPLHLFNEDLGIAFSLFSEETFRYVLNRSIFTLLFSLALLVIIILLLYDIIRNIRREKEQLASSEKSLRQIIDLLPIGVIILDENQNILTINKTAGEILSIANVNELIGKSISDRFLMPENYLKPGPDTNAFDSHHFIYYKNKGHEVVILKREIPVMIDGRQCVVEAFFDVTPIERSRRQEAAANMAKSEFLAKMSHEIRTPMNGIIGMADALARKELPPEENEQVTIIRKSADLLMSILNDILDYSKIEAGKMIVEDIPFSLRQEINWAIDLFQPAAREKGILLHCEIEPNVIDPLIGDPFKLRQILTNLISNAVKFTHYGEVLISVEQIENYSGNLTLAFDVEDTGIGIPKEKLNQIFATYQQADGGTARKYGGTGLGTTIAKQLVELLNGEINVESPSRISTDPKYPGTRFHFTMEVFSNEKLKKDYNFGSITRYSSIHCLLITNDEEADADLIDTLKNTGINTELVSPKTSIVEFLKKYVPGTANPFHVIIITDSNFLNGFALAKTIRDNGLAEHFLQILVSSRDKQGNFIRCKQLWIDYYLIKPFDRSEIFDIFQDNFPSIIPDQRQVRFAEKIRPDLSILLAEDNAINIKVAQTIFKTLGLETTIVTNGIQAVEKVKTEKFDIVFMDLLMPEKDGLQATIEIRALGYQLPIIAMTASASREDKTRAMSIGMTAYITKPIKLEDVKAILLQYAVKK